MVARISSEDLVLYGNAALARYLDLNKGALIGMKLETLARRCHGEIAECFERPEGGRTTNRLVTDSQGRVFEIKTYSDGGVLDLVFDEVTTAELISRELRQTSGTPPEKLTEDELKTARQPERRYLTVSFSQLRGLSHSIERLPPMEARLMATSFIEEASDAIFAIGCSVGETLGDSVLGIFGAPRYFADHPFRAVRAACDLSRRMSTLRRGFYRHGKELPPFSCGIWTGDALIGTVGNSVWQHYTALGGTVDLSEKLGRLARAGEILLPEHTLQRMLEVLPEGWQHIRAESEEGPDLSDFEWASEEITPVPDELRKVVYLVGPNVIEQTDQIEYYFDYVWALKVPGYGAPVPILRVVRPSPEVDALALGEDNVVSGRSVQTLGKYKLYEVIGSGGMGKVWRGVDRFGNDVALKVLHATAGSDGNQFRRFRREAEIMAKLPHRNICRVYEMSEFEGIQFLAMEYVAGLTLSDLLYEKTKEETTGENGGLTDLRTLIRSIRSVQAIPQPPVDPEGPPQPPPPRPKITRVLPVEQTLSIFLKVCDAVQFAHEHGVLHRDLKPGNILIREDGEPLVVDFGLAKLRNSDSTFSLSITGHVVGTVENMAPEQAESSKDVDERADVYALGTILYQMLTGHRHFEASGNLVADAQTLKTHEPVKPRTLNPHIDPDLEIITLKALRYDPKERYRNVAVLRADIEHYRRGEIISAKPVSPAAVLIKLAQRHKAVSIVAAASFLILFAAGLIFVWQLGLRLEREQEALRNAREQMRLAELSAEEANTQRKNAQDEKERAVKALAELNAAQKEKDAAQTAAAEAERSTAQAKKETATEREERDKAEKKAAQAEKQAEELLAKQKELQAQRVSSAPTPEPIDPVVAAAQAALAKALADYNLGYTQSMLLAIDRNPEVLINRLTALMDSISKALIVERSSVSGWMMLGRIHLIFGEYNQAIGCFTEAIRSQAEDTKWNPKDGDTPEDMLQVSQDTEKRALNKSQRLVEFLKASPVYQNNIAAGVMQFISTKPSLRKYQSSTQTRALSNAEILLQLAMKNPTEARFDYTPATENSRASMEISGAEELPDLSLLKALNVGSLTITGAQKIDWLSLMPLYLDVLDVSNCMIDRIPVEQFRGLMRLKSVQASNSGIWGVEFVRYTPVLETLDISNSKVGDVLQLQSCPKLRDVNLAGLNPANLRSLFYLPLESLVISPELISDKVGLDSLRKHKTLRTLRAPSDPAGMPVAEFWKRYDAGAYVPKGQSKKENTLAQ